MSNMEQQDFIEKWRSSLDSRQHSSEQEEMALKEMWDDAHFGDCVPGEIMPSAKEEKLKLETLRYPPPSKSQPKKATPPGKSAPSQPSQNPQRPPSKKAAPPKK